jgi:hypothetical protein
VVTSTETNDRYALTAPAAPLSIFMAFEYTLAAKWLELLKEIAPKVTRTAVRRFFDCDRNRSVCGNSNC